MAKTIFFTLSGLTCNCLMLFGLLPVLKMSGLCKVLFFIIAFLSSLLISIWHKTSTKIKLYQYFHVILICELLFFVIVFCSGLIGKEDDIMYLIVSLIALSAIMRNCISGGRRYEYIMSKEKAENLCGQTFFCFIILFILMTLIFANIEIIKNINKADCFCLCFIGYTLDLFFYGIGYTEIIVEATEKKCKMIEEEE